MVTATAMMIAVCDVRWAFRADVFAMELATLTEYWPIDSTLTPPIKLPSRPSQTSR